MKYSIYKYRYIPATISEHSKVLLVQHGPLLVGQVESSGMELSPPEDNAISELCGALFTAPSSPLHLAHSTLLENESSALEEFAGSSSNIRLRIAQILAGKKQVHKKNERNK